MERQLPAGRPPRLVSSLGLGQRCSEVTLDQERGLLAWRHPRRGGGERGAERGGAGGPRGTCRAAARVARAASCRAPSLREGERRPGSAAPCPQRQCLGVRVRPGALGEQRGAEPGSLCPPGSLSPAPYTWVLPALRRGQAENGLGVTKGEKPALWLGEETSSVSAHCSLVLWQHGRFRLYLHQSTAPCTYRTLKVTFFHLRDLVTA